MDVMEGVKCMVYGRPKEIPRDKLGVYFTYAGKYVKNLEGNGGGKQFILDDGGSGENSEEVQKSME